MADTDEGEGEEGEEAVKANPAKKQKMMIIIIAVAVLLLGGVGGALYLFVFSSSEPAQAENAHGASASHGAKDAHGAAKDAHGTAKDGHGAGKDGEHTGPGGVAYFDMPEFLVNIQGTDGSAAYLKLSISLEVPSEADKTALEGLQPRITDQLQSYLRELRTDDLKGSAGVMRVKEEMLRRVRVAAAPYKVRDVLLKEMVVQ